MVADRATLVAQRFHVLARRAVDMFRSDAAQLAQATPSPAVSVSVSKRHQPPHGSIDKVPPLASASGSLAHRAGRPAGS